MQDDMNRKLAAILALIDDFVESNKDAIVANEREDARGWDDGIVAVIRKELESGDSMLHVLRTYAEEIASEPDQELLTSVGVVAQKFESRTQLRGKKRPTFVINLDKFRGLVKKGVKKRTKDKRLEERLREQEAEIRVLRDMLDTESRRADLVEDLIATNDQRREAHLGRFEVNTVERRGNRDPLVPTLFLSDWHFDEVVEPSQIEGMNAYNREIALRRAEQVFRETYDLLFHQLSGANYDGRIVIPLGGDMLSGNIHDELRETNEAPITESIIVLAELLEKHIRALAKEFKKAVYVPCVVGNHGRYDRKPRAKGAAVESYDWLVYKILQRNLRDLKHVQVDIPESLDISWRVFGTGYHMTHGEQFKGGGGIGGKWPTLFRGDYKKRKRAQAMGQGYDVLLMGHWHAYGCVDGLLVNGSLKGMDEYAYRSNFEFQAPTQALWMTHPSKGMYAQYPIIINDEMTAGPIKDPFGI